MLRKLIQQIIETSDEDDLDIATISENVFKAIGRKEHATALVEAIPVVVRDVIVDSRTYGPVHPPSDPVLASKTSGSTPSAKSWKVLGIRDDWKNRLNEIHATGAGNKRLRDCTAIDLIFMAEELELQSSRKMAKAKGWRALAKALDKAGAKRVLELDTRTLAITLGTPVAVAS